VVAEAAPGQVTVGLPPRRLWGKSARRDLHMLVNGWRVCLEPQNGHPTELRCRR
jgi:hypothetical protein